MQRAIQNFARPEGEDRKTLKKFKKKFQLFIGKRLAENSKRGK